MALVAGVKDGKFVESASQDSLSSKVKSSNDGMDKDAFLQLLVAQMKYQDPLEPTSNTEYISQYAQFSQVEQMQNMAGSMDLQRASSLVGEQVYIKTTDATGNTNYVQGKVDYVVYENGKAYLSIDEQLYSIDDLDTVADKEYLVAYDKAKELVQGIMLLPNVMTISLEDAEKVDELQKSYEEMNDYEKRFVASDMKKTLDKYVDRIKELRVLAGEIAPDESEDETEVPDEGADEIPEEEA